MATKTGTAKRAPGTTPAHVAAKPPRGQPARHRLKAWSRIGQKKKRTAGFRQAPNFVAPVRGRTRVSIRRRLLLALSILLMVAGLGIVAYPFIPIVRYTVLKPAPVVPYETRLSTLAQDANVSPSDVHLDQVTSVAPPTSRGRRPAPAPSAKRLVIPKIGVNVEIVFGTDQDEALNRGIWHIPGTSTPEKGSNTVLSGHRFRFLSGPRTLYLLDKVTKGDPIIIYWNGKEYDYVVTGSKIVQPNQVEILDPTDETRLTIFTCAPLFSTKERLVLFAKPI